MEVCWKSGLLKMGGLLLISIFFVQLAAWYAVAGGMQDYNYWLHGCSEITVELTCCKYPAASNLQQIWLDNKQALLEYLKRANTGIRGLVRFANGQPAENMTVRIDQREPYFKTNRDGEFYRILNDGTYKLTIMLNCQAVYEATVTVQGLLVFNVTLPANVSTAGHTLSRYPVFCQQQIQKCTTYNNDASINNWNVEGINLGNSGNTGITGNSGLALNAAISGMSASAMSFRSLLILALLLGIVLL